MARGRGARVDPAEAKENYEVKLAIMPEAYKVKTPRMKEHSVRIEGLMREMEDIYRILDEAGITRKDRIDYLNYARKLIRLKARYSGAALKKAVSEERPKWEAIGLDRALMAKIESKILGEAGGAAGGTVTIK